MSEKLLNTDEVAELVGKKKSTVTKWIEKGWLNAEKKRDGRWYVTAKELENAQKVLAEKHVGRPKKGSCAPTQDEILKGDPWLMLVKAIVQDTVTRYRECLVKGNAPYAHEAYIRSKDFSMITGGLVDPEELIRRMRARYAQ